MADLETLKTRLVEAEEAWHALQTGARVVEVRRDGKLVKYQASNRGELASYVAELKRQIEVAEDAAAGRLPRRRFIPVAFG